MINTVLFDLDGTIVHHGHALLPPLLAEWGYDHEYEEVTDAVAHAIHHFYNHIAQAEQQGWVAELFREFYHLMLVQLEIPDEAGRRSAAIQDFFREDPVPPLFDDIMPVLETLRERNTCMGVITQRGRAGATRFLATHGIAGFFDVLVAGDDGHGRKPAAGPFHQALAVLERLAAASVYVGDRIDDDCEGANGAGLQRAFLIDRDRVFTLEAADRSDFVHLTEMGQLLDYLDLE